MSTKTLERLQVLISAEGSQLSSALNSAASQVDKFGKRLTGLGRTLSTRVTAPIAGLGAVSVKAFADFDQAMNQSVAIMGDVSDTLRSEMGAAAKEVARTTTTSAADAGEAFFFLASAGLDAQQSIAALPQVAAFAQAGMFDMATATDLATDAQSALGLASDDAQENLKNLTRVTDVLVEANKSANATVQQFSEALTNKAGAALRSLNKDIEEGAAVLAVFADQGIKGSQAGTTMSAVIRGLTQGVQRNADVWKEQGIAVFDADGEMRNFADIIADMEGALGGLSVEQQRATLAQLGFTEETLQGTLALIGNSDAVRDYEARYRSAGGAVQEVAAKQLESFSSQLKVVKDNLGLAGIEIGQALAPAIGKLGEVIVKVTDFIQNLNPAVVRWGVVIAGVAAAIGPVLLVVGQLSIAVGALLGTLGGAGAVFAALTGPIGLAVAAVVAAGVAFFKWREEITGFISGALEPLKPIFASLVEVLQAFGGLIMEIAGPILKPLAQVLGVVLIGALKALVMGLQLTAEALNVTLVPALQGVAAAIRFMTDAFVAGKDLTATAVNAIVGFVADMVARLRELMGAGIQAAFGPALAAIDKVKGAFSNLFDAVVGKSFIPDMVEEIGKWMGKLDTVLAGSAEKATGRTVASFSQMAAHISAKLDAALQEILAFVREAAGSGFFGKVLGAGLGFITGGLEGAIDGFGGGFDPFPVGGQPGGRTGGPTFGPPRVSSASPAATQTLRLSFDAESIPELQLRSPEALAVDTWYRRLISEALRDAKVRGAI